jgi:hypothetical protein
MESPTLAFMSLGENFRAPLPTSTEMVAAVTTAAEAAATRVVEKYMFEILISFQVSVVKGICKSTASTRQEGDGY